MSACTATRKNGLPCKANPRGDTGLCNAHSPREVQESSGFGGSQPGAGRPRNPRAVDVLRERVEQNIDKYLAPIDEALEATSGVVVGNGRDAHVEILPDYGLRLKASQMALDRVYGRPRQAMELTGPEGGPVETVSIVPLDAEQRSARAAELLKRHGHVDA